MQCETLLPRDIAHVTPHQLTPEISRIWGGLRTEDRVTGCLTAEVLDGKVFGRNKFSEIESTSTDALLNCTIPNYRG